MTFAPPDAEPAASGPRPWDFQRRLPGFAPTPLHSAPELARELGIAALYVKDEGARLGLSSVKPLGTTWAAWRWICEAYGVDPAGPAPVSSLGLAFRGRGVRELVCASAGNHGHSVAWLARTLGLRARVFLPASGAGDAAPPLPSRQRAIVQLGARLVEVPGDYEDAVQAAREAVGRDSLLLMDHAWEGYERIPMWVMEGYSTLAHEVDRELAARELPLPHFVFVQVGVGALAGGLALAWRDRGRSWRPRLVGVEPSGGACARAAFEARAPVQLATCTSKLAGLACRQVSSLALPVLTAGLSALIEIEDAEAHAGVEALAARGLKAGPAGAAGYAGLAHLAGGGSDGLAQLIGLGPESRVLVILTEGPDAG